MQPFIHESSYIDEGVTIAEDTKIWHFCHVQADNVFCGPSVVFTNDPYPRAEHRPERYTPTRVCEGASIGANATVVCGVTIGRFAMVGAGSVVTHDVPDCALVTGVPARQVGRVCPCGGRLGADGRCTVCGQTIK